MTETQQRHILVATKHQKLHRPTSVHRYYLNFSTKITNLTNLVSVTVFHRT